MACTSDPVSRRSLRSGAAKFLVLVVLALSTASCGSVQRGEVRDLPIVAAPVFDEIWVDGLTVRASRVAGRSSSVSTQQGYGSTQFSTTPYSTPYATVSGQHSSTNVHNTTHWENYDDDSIRHMLARAIEDEGLTVRSTPNSSTRITGRVTHQDGSTGIAKIGWNVLNTFGPGFLGLPYLGSAEATVELRVHRDGQLLGRYEGHGTATWRHTFYGVLAYLGRVKQKARNEAAATATIDALASLLEDSDAFQSSTSE